MAKLQEERSDGEWTAPVGERGDIAWRTGEPREERGKTAPAEMPGRFSGRMEDLAVSL